MILEGLFFWLFRWHQVGPKTIANSTHCLCTPGEDEEDGEEVEEFETTTAAPTTLAATSAASDGNADSQSGNKGIKRKRFRRSVNKVSFASKY